MNSFSPIFNRVSINVMYIVLQGLIGIASVPIFTLVLGPEDYGILGMSIAVAALFSGACEIGSSYLLYGHYQTLDKSRRESIHTTLLAINLGLGLLVGGIVYLLWPLLVQFVPLISKLNTTDTILLCLMIPVRTVLSVMSPILIVNHRSELLAGALFIQSVINFLISYVCIFVFDIGYSALFWGQISGQLGTLLLTYAAFAFSARARLSTDWLTQLKPIIFGAWILGILESGRSTLESALISGKVSSEALGNYNHARLYQGIVSQFINAIANILWPIALDEAKNPNSDFIRIRPIWDFVYVILICIGIGTVFLGNNIVMLLTNGKFLQAANFLPWLIIYILLQNAGKPATALIFFSQRGNLYSKVRLFTLIGGCLALMAFVPVYGVGAILTILICEMFFTRVFFFVATYRKSKKAFQDHWVIVGCLLIVSCWYAEQFQQLSLTSRLLLATLLSCIVLLSFFVSQRMKY